MQDAATQLCAPHVRVRDVALACGFDDPYQFSRTFRRTLGMWPLHFMQLKRSNEMHRT
jgi:AraC-like DNA-binding protein